jgi:hypothetical protein
LYQLQRRHNVAFHWCRELDLLRSVRPRGIRGSCSECLHKLRSW